MTLHLVLRLDAPLMSFGGAAVDADRITDDVPGTSMLTGLFANALGYERSDYERLDRLQARLRYASMFERYGDRIVDFQTVDLGQAHLVDTGWTTTGRVEKRGKGDATRGTHIRTKHFLVDALVLVSCTLDNEGESPTISDLAAALASPERPLFIGRKTCVPSAPLLVGVVDATSLLEALTNVAPSPRRDGDAHVAYWPEGEGPDDTTSTPMIIRDFREHQNQVHVGHRVLRRGTVRTTPELIS